MASRDVHAETVVNPIVPGQLLEYKHPDEPRFWLRVLTLERATERGDGWFLCLVLELGPAVSSAKVMKAYDMRLEHSGALEWKVIA